MPNGADNLVLSGGLVPPPRRCARNEKKDKRSLVEKEIDTGACLIEAHPKGVTGVGEHQTIAPPEGREALPNCSSIIPGLFLPRCAFFVFLARDSAELLERQRKVV